MAKPVKVGLIGVGFMGKMHFGVHKASKRSKIVAIADVDQKKLDGDWSAIGGNIDDPSARNVDLKGIRKYTNAAALINDPEVELADITAGINMAIAGRSVSLVRRVGIIEDVTVTGGCAKNAGLINQTAPACPVPPIGP